MKYMHRVQAVSIVGAMALGLAACGGSDDPEPVYPPRAASYTLPKIVGAAGLEVPALFAEVGEDQRAILAAEVTRASGTGLFLCELMHDEGEASWRLVVTPQTHGEMLQDQCVVVADTRTGELTVTIDGLIDTMEPRADSPAPVDGGTTGTAGSVLLRDVISASDSLPVRTWVETGYGLPIGVSYDAATGRVSWAKSVPDTFTLTVNIADEADNVSQVLLVVERNGITFPG